jgi:hypothetical protein
MTVDTRDIIEEVAEERRRQQDKEGWTPEHDDTHAEGELAAAAGCYALTAVDQARGDQARAPLSCWPWDESWWKPKDQRRNLIRAAALIVAEIERLDRATLSRGIAP